VIVLLFSYPDELWVKSILKVLQYTSPQGGIIEPTATGVHGKPVFGLLGQVSGGYGEKKVQAPL
jgi:hypothetical protein